VATDAHDHHAGNAEMIDYGRARGVLSIPFTCHPCLVWWRLMSHVTWPTCNISKIIGLSLYSTGSRL